MLYKSDRESNIVYHNDNNIDKKVDSLSKLYVLVEIKKITYVILKLHKNFINQPKLSNDHIKKLSDFQILFMFKSERIIY